ncbi:hypothetical protein JAAARDRAFT_175136 [Jaapia argillacea MUCL 33604]|uniref:Uncharacterized protein n=1 Tax=Jaapia argillacea MUCL 33604 TaxID=933084 RepID=A0A067PY86_9AGAM|nr:hypothetical protein JAAARDRAFT_175136 [Jaapia argillacea MUCL 33604]
MEEASSSDGDTPLSHPTVASILGIKGSLRFRPHGSTQKAHVVLRRVETSDYSSDEDAGSKPLIYFSLFAQKRIEVKPGKEILLAVSSEDGRFKDQPLIFEGDAPGSEDSSDEEDPMVVDEDDCFASEVSPSHAMPPKLRKGWSKTPYDVTPLAEALLSHPIHTDVGVQAQCDYVATSVQAQPLCTSATVQASPSLVSEAIQVEPSRSSRHVEAIPPPPAVRLACASQTTPDTRSAEIQTDILVEEPSHVLSTTVDDAMDEFAGEPDRQRSLSPMELDSPTSSPPQSPVSSHPPPSIDLKSRQHSIESSVPSPQISRDILRTEEVVSPSSPPPVDSPNLITPPVRQKSLSPVLVPSPISSSVASSKSPSLPDTPLPVETTTTTPLIDGSHAHLNTQVVPIQPPKAPPTHPKMHYMLRGAPPPTLPITLGKRGRSPPAGPRSLRSLQSSFSHGKSESPSVMSPIASSSYLLKLPTEPLPAEIVSPPPPTTAAPPLPNTNPPSSTGFKKLPSNPPSTSQQLQSSPSTSKNWAKPVYIPSGTVDNPLGIRPSVMIPFKKKEPPVSTPVSGTPTGAPSLQGPKKTIVVGSGWPLVRHHSNGSGHTQPGPSSSTSPSRLVVAPPNGSSHARQTTQAATASTAPSAPTPELSSIVSYTSPSPPPLYSHPRPPTKAPPPSASAPAPPKALLPSPGTSSTLPPTSASLSSSISLPIVAPPPSSSSQKTPRSSLNPVKSEPISSVIPPSKEVSRVRAELSPIPGLSSSQSRPRSPASTGAALGGPSQLPPPSVPGHKSSTDVYTPAEVPNGHLNGTRPAPAPFTHPLPPKPMAAPGPAPHKFEPNRPVIGVKRSASLATRDNVDSPIASPRRRFLRWPTIECIHSVRLKGDDVAVRGIVFSNSGSQFAVNCSDCTVRIWNNHNHTEVAKLSHSTFVVDVAWMDGDAGVVSLGENGIVSKWTRLGQHKWHWAKILDSGRNDEAPTCLAYMRDRIAVAFPRMGVKVWIWMKGAWQPQRSILRQNVTCVKFIEDGEALLGGTTDGVLWYCQVPNGTLRAYSFFKSKVYSLDVNLQGTHGLLAQSGGRAHLVGILQDDLKGKVAQVYVSKDTDIQLNANYDFGAVFTGSSQTVLFGVYQGCVLAWDKDRGEIVGGLDHGEDVSVLAVASFEPGISSPDGYLVTGTKQGQLTWWPQPQAKDEASRKRLKASDLS